MSAGGLPATLELLRHALLAHALPFVGFLIIVIMARLLATGLLTARGSR